MARQLLSAVARGPQSGEPNRLWPQHWLTLFAEPCRMLGRKMMEHNGTLKNSTHFNICSWLQLHAHGNVQELGLQVSKRVPPLASILMNDTLTHTAAIFSIFYTTCTSYMSSISFCVLAAGFLRELRTQNCQVILCIWLEGCDDDPNTCYPDATASDTGEYSCAP